MFIVVVSLYFIFNISATYKALSRSKSLVNGRLYTRQVRIYFMKRLTCLLFIFRKKTGYSLSICKKALRKVNICLSTYFLNITYILFSKQQYIGEIYIKDIIPSVADILCLGLVKVFIKNVGFITKLHILCFYLKSTYKD